MYRAASTRIGSCIRPCLGQRQDDRRDQPYLDLVLHELRQIQQRLEDVGRYVVTRKHHLQSTHQTELLPATRHDDGQKESNGFLHFLFVNPLQRTLCSRNIYFHFFSSERRNTLSCSSTALMLQQSSKRIQ